MELQFRQKHISIDEFDPVNIPDFVVLTGVNGSGKSHLLGGLEQRKIVISGMENAHVVLFNYETFKLDNEGAFNAQQITSEREQAWGLHQQSIKPNVQSWRSVLGEEKYTSYKNSCESENKSFLSLEYEEINPYKVNLRNFFNSHKQNHQIQSIFNIVKKIPYSIDEIEHDDFMRFYKPYTFKNNFLPNQLGKILWDYYEKYLRNQINAFENEKQGKGHRVLSEEEFLDIHGEKPWELINRILETFDTMQYKVNSPEGLGYFENFQLKLVHTEKKNIEIDFDSLSSGEKILMALIASIYKSSSDKNFPDILLLDEVDASLHPAMMKNMLDVIQKIFVKEGVKVILVSHSPTTIALAPEESIFVMNKSGRNRIEKKSKQDALAILTQGFATIEQGLKLFDAITPKFTIITEGNNTTLISKALELLGVNDVDIQVGFEGKSGKTQLKTLFDFMSKIPRTNKVIFVWDCDAEEYCKLIPSNNTYPFVLPKNDENKIAKKGIENMFSEELFENFTKTISLPNEDAKVEFHEGSKRAFEASVVSKNNPADFQKFSILVAEIERIKNDS